MNFQVMGNKNSLKLVIFDAEGTFIRIHPPAGYYYANLWQKAGVKLEPEALQKRIKEVYRQVFQGQKTLIWNEELCREAWKSFFTLLFNPYRHLSCFEDLFQEAYAYFGSKDCVIPIPGFTELAKELRDRGIRLACLSNWDGRLYAILKAWQLDQFFDQVYSACTVGYLKPHPESFLHVLRDFNVSPQEALMIGDSLEDDVLPAKALGMKAIQYQGENYQELLPSLLNL